MKKLAAVMVAMLGCGVGWGQASAGALTDSQTLQAILVEMRGIHNDVRLSETTQILLTELEVQHGAVDKAMEKRDNARTRVSQVQMNEKNFTTQITQLEENEKATIDPVQQKRYADQEQMLKTQMTNFKTQEQDAGNALADAENALRKEQETLSGIQAELDAVVKQLQPAGK
jgi:peptidoglycan hydrolase CwlO-like protein